MAEKANTDENSFALKALGHAFCGMAMGTADIIPGVSGGTVALVLGIYTRLVTAISHVDAYFLKQLVARRWGDAARHIDLTFLLALGVGIATGILAMGVVIHELLQDEFARPLTFAAFFGMIAASAYLVVKLVKCQSPAELAGGAFVAVAAAAFAWWLTTLGLSATDSPSLGYLFLCGMIAICAMILPGISGAHILLILGAYTFVTGILRGLAHGEIALDTLISLAVFACGCLVGLLAFSKVLRWMLANYHALTMAALCGFMIGALRRVWPFQTLELKTLGDKEREVFTPTLPQSFGSHELLAVVIAVAACAAVLLIDWWAKAKSAKQQSARGAG